jgi:TatD DNase family protein
LIDTHCHLFLDQFREDLKEVLNRAVEVGIDDIFMPAIDFDSLEAMDHLRHPEIRFHKMAGIHPTQVDGTQTRVEEKLFNHCRQKTIIAVGETGLDYYWSTEYKQQQKKILRTHCKVAKEVDKPVVLHNRSSTPDLLDIIEDEQDGSLRGVWHCFDGSPEEGQRAIDLGLYLGIGGLLTFKNADVDKSVADLPLKHMMVETDAPYLAPEPHRGKRNEPAFVIHTAQKLADIFDVSLEKVEGITDQNARELFGISHS